MQNHPIPSNNKIHRHKENLLINQEVIAHYENLSLALSQLKFYINQSDDNPYNIEAIKELFEDNVTKILCYPKPDYFTQLGFEQEDFNVLMQELKNYMEIIRSYSENSIDENQLKENFKNILNQSWYVSQSAAHIHEPNNFINYFYREIAAVIDSKAQNTLLMPKVNRQDIYCNEFDEMEVGQFIISEDETVFISLSDLVEMAYNYASTAQSHPFRYTNAKGEVTFLTEKEKERILTQIPDIKSFFETVDNYYDITKDTLLNLFQILRQGLLAGDVKHQGKELDCGAAANVAIVKFFERWDVLPPKIQQKLRQLKSKQSYQNLGDILDHLRKSEKEANSNSINYCIEILGRNLEAIIFENKADLSEQVSQSTLEEEKEKALATIKLLITQACRHGFLSQVQFLIRQDASLVNKHTDKHHTMPLHWAAYNGHLEIVKALLKNGARVNTVRYDMVTPLHFAVENDHLEIVVELLANGAKVNANDSRLTPLHWAAYNGHLEIVKALLAKGARVNTLRDYEVTPLHFAAYNGHLEVVEALLANGANVRAINDSRLTPLHWAAYNGHLEIVKALLAKGANVNAINDSGLTPLHFASYNGHLEIVEALLANGANVNALLDDKVTPLHFAAENSHLEIVKTLLANGANVNALRDDKVTLLHFQLKIVILRLLKHYLQTEPM